jgi:8-oxo-dGTP diphosphatase
MTKISLFLIFLLQTVLAQAVVYKEPSENFKPKIEVAALFIEHDNRILLLHRQEAKPQGNLWGIPGGKLDKGETPLQAVLREIKEETGYDFSKQTVESLGTVYIEYNEKEHFTYHMFRTKLVGDPGAVKINFLEHKGFTWVSPQDGLKLDLIKDEDACFKLIYGL